MDPTGYSSNRKENRSGIKYEFIVLYDPNEWRKKEEKLEKDFKKSDSILEKACILGQYSALSWKKRYNFVKKQYQVMVNDIAPGLISPEQSGMADAGLSSTISRAK